MRRLLIAILGFSFLPPLSLSASCFMPGLKDPRENAKFYVNGADTIFIGKVKAIRSEFPFHLQAGRKVDSRRHVVFEASETFKGVSQDPEVLTGSRFEDYPFQVGQSYLVFAHTSDGALQTSICTATTPLSGAGVWLNYFRTGEWTPEPQSTSRTGEVCGRVEGAISSRRLEATLYDRGADPPAAARSVNIKSDGTFCISDVEPGDYSLAVRECACHVEKNPAEQPSSRLMGSYGDDEINSTGVSVQPGRTVENLIIHVQSEPVFAFSGHLSPTPERGRVIVQMISATSPADAFSSSVENGEFHFAEVPAGSYVLFAEQDLIDSHFERMPLTDSTPVTVVGDVKDYLLK